MAGTLNTVFPAGTIITCPCCGLGLYKVASRVTTQEVVFDDGTILVPLNATIPARTGWTPLICPHCGGRLFKDGKVHTLQYGWL